MNSTNSLNSTGLGIGINNSGNNQPFTSTQIKSKASKSQPVLHMKQFEFYPTNLANNSKVDFSNDSSWRASTKIPTPNSGAPNAIRNANTPTLITGAISSNTTTTMNTVTDNTNRQDPNQKKAISRTEQEKKENPERFNLDKRNLTFIPQLENESQLKLLNFQYNQIQKIENLRNLNNLIFLDLYNNKIKTIEGLEELGSLRVLMLGKNLIEKIENLELLKRLDVLDLHNNKIKTIENISHLKELRVLNLAGNQISIVENLQGLISLTEINLRRNQITSVKELDTLPNLQRIFLSNNLLKLFDNISCIFQMNSLMELSLDGNPLTNSSVYRQYMLQKIKTLRHLDLKRITEEERKSANDENFEEKPFESNQSTTSVSIKTLSSISTDIHQHHLTSIDTSKEQDLLLNEKSYAEINGNTLIIFGTPTIDFDKSTYSVDGIVFKNVNFGYICDVYAPKIPSKFPNITTLTFQNNNLTKLCDLDRLGSIRRKIVSLIIEQNPICSLSIMLRQYISFTFPSVLQFDGEKITQEIRTKAQEKFGHRETVLKGFVEHDTEGYSESTSAATKYVDSVLFHAFTIDSKMKCIDQEWDKVISELVDETMARLDNFVSSPFDENSQTLYEHE